MAEVDADGAAGLQVDHEVGQVAVAYPQDVLADTDERVRDREVRAQREERLRRRRHVQVRAPGKSKRQDGVVIRRSGWRGRDGEMCLAVFESKKSVLMYKILSNFCCP